MRELTVNDAFGLAPPRSAALLCLPAGDGGTDIIAAPWFTWLNTKHNPMLSFSLSSEEEMGKRLESGDKLYLVFTNEKETASCAAGMHLAPPETPGELPVQLPAGTRAVLCGALSHKYKYPFKKVRIFNCDLEQAYGIEQEED